ncbi:MAG: hypothetical protein BLITH_0577 [Brockia lithotrophica]|uniref:Uncharacterized protein n=1 Tax=Brockia lithotrophica TaxID=933949 RepID=A0A2T5G4M8_9BACL|nr:hypothetical protein [Brockia lithotrophica]MBT9253274.1 hypothetical protein [Brockia lithotrophica]PTQ51147.1 MAG: hypothetical protein BLITH_0577 [Brockia lithotrophica]
MGSRRIASEFRALDVWVPREDGEKLLYHLRSRLRARARVLDNGDVEIHCDDRVNRIVLHIETFPTKFHLRGEGYLTDRSAAEVLRSAVLRHRGSCVMIRYFQGFAVVYRYDTGRVEYIEKVPMHTFLRSTPTEVAEGTEVIFRARGRSEGGSLHGPAVALPGGGVSRKTMRERNSALRGASSEIVVVDPEDFRRIAQLREAIDRLLDARLRYAGDEKRVRAIDARLKRLVQKLLQLEG